MAPTQSPLESSGKLKTKQNKTETTTTTTTKKPRTHKVLPNADPCACPRLTFVALYSLYASAFGSLWSRAFEVTKMQPPDPSPTADSLRCQYLADRGFYHATTAL